MATLKEAIGQSQKYAAYFHLPLDHTNLHHWLISDKIVSEKTLAAFPIRLTKQERREMAQRKRNSVAKRAQAVRVSRFLRHFPTISLVAITGSLAISNTKPDDDIDLMLVTRPHTLWLTRLLAVPLLSLFFKRRLPREASGDVKAAHSDEICLNLWLDETALAVPPRKRSLYTAHEVLQALPLFDRSGVYFNFLQANKWAAKYLANAYQLATQRVVKREQGSKFGILGVGVRPDDSRGRDKKLQIFGPVHALVKLLNNFAFKLQYLYMKKRITRETITLHSAYFHPKSLTTNLNRYLGLY